ncbi:CoA-binding protein [Elusimicrobiota bacterium]
MQKIIDCSCFVVAGSFKDESKYAYKILMALSKKGKSAYPVNPKGGLVGAAKCYESLKEVPARIEAVSLVTPPAVTEDIVKECKEMKIKYVWMQPGAESSEAIEFCEKNGIQAIYRDCLYIKLL